MAVRHRNANAYARRGPTREPYDYVLIVCEGTKTEPHYFKRLRVVNRLSSANVIITPADRRDPMGIVSFAERFVDQYDRVFCVFDRDGHANYDQALHRIASLPCGRDGRLKAITSWPCFELWALLHFRYSSAAIEASGGRSSGEIALSQLREFLPNYAKGCESTFDDLLPNLDAAFRHAERLQRENARTGSLNPDTKVHELVKYLLNLKGS